MFSEQHAVEFVYAFSVGRDAAILGKSTVHLPSEIET